MASSYGDNNQVNAPKLIDNKMGRFATGAWRPYNDLAEARATVVQAYRAKGQVVHVLKDGVLTEYWWRDGVTDNDLIEKTTASSGSGFSGNYNDLTNKPTIPDSLADLTDDTTHRTVTDAEKTTWNAKATASDIATAKSEILGGVATEGDNLAKLLAKIETITSIIGGTAPDGGSLVSTVAELLAIFSTYPEGTDIATVLAGKIDTSKIVNTLTETVTGKVLDATQGKALKDLIDALSTTVGNKANQSDLTTLQTTVSNNTTAIAGKEPAIETGTAQQYVAGDKSLRTFLSDVMGSVLTGLSTVSNMAISATDTILVSFGKVQAQITHLVNVFEYQKNFSVRVSQLDSFVPIPLDVRVNITLTPITHVGSIYDFMLTKNNIDGPVRSTLAELNADIAALTLEEANAGYSISFRVTPAAGKDYATLIYKSTII